MAKQNVLKMMTGRKRKNAREKKKVVRRRQRRNILNQFEELIYIHLFNPSRKRRWNLGANMTTTKTIKAANVKI